MTGLNSLYKCRNGCKIGNLDAVPIRQGLCIKCAERELGLKYESLPEDVALLEYLRDPQISVNEKLDVLDMRFAELKKKADNGNGDSDDE